MCGSSPRGRGKPRPRGWGKSPFRLIPARAGKTRGAVNDALAPATHPRAGGENLTPAGRLVIDGGSSPRGRGKPRPPDPKDLVRGLIPARAGKTYGAPLSPIFHAAHPRAGGENLFTASARDDPWGSSPRGRGKRVAVPPHSDVVRLIPARAGKTARRSSRRSLTSAHPRAGGENQANRNTGGCELGSSPRGRGKREGEGGSCCPERLIPARAGKTVGEVLDPVGGAAHPRAGGENSGGGGGGCLGAGSSPRGRGKR